MKALSVRQPWAWLIVEGHKDIENRDWFTKGRGDVLIHAAKGCTQAEYDDAMEFVRTKVKRVINVPKLSDLERGGIVGMVRITGCVEQSPSPWFVGRYGFVIEKPYPLPFRPMRGMLGFFEVDGNGEPQGDPLTTDGK